MKKMGDKTTQGGKVKKLWKDKNKMIGEKKQKEQKDLITYVDKPTHQVG
jgi:hypothetical protein